MTKDRRLGRGLAALLGTPLDENSTQGMQISQPNANASNSASAAQPASRPDIIRQFASEGRSHLGTSSKSGISPISIPMQSADVPASQGTLELKTSLIDPNPFQPRRFFDSAEIESLAQSLLQHQQLQPVLVRRVGDRYQLISGERRLRATIHAGLPTIRAEVREADDRLVAELAIIENLQRKDLNAIEKAMSFKRYITEHQCTQEELANRLKIDRSTIANMMRLLELPEAITDAIQKEVITAGHAKALLSLGSTKEQHNYLAKIVENGWSVRETESQVAEAVANAAADEDGILSMPPRRRPSKSAQLQSLESDLKMQLGTRVDISQSGRGRGKITIHFTSVEEFDRLRTLLANDLKRKAA